MLRPVLASLTAVACAVSLAGCSQDPPQQLAVGDCLVISGVGDRGDSVPTVACDEAHEAEVYVVADVDGPADYDEDAVVAAVEELCLDRFAAFTGQDYATSRLDIFYTWPLADGWGEGDREAVCAAFVPDASGTPQLFEGTLDAG